MAQATTAQADGCALQIRREQGSRTEAWPLVVALHARGGDAASGIAFGREVFGAEPAVVAPQAARPCNPMQSNFQSAASYAGFSWYLGSDPSRPEAASFGDSLAQISELLDSLDRPVVVAGEGQGAVLAVALAMYGAASMLWLRKAAFPSIEGWKAPAAFPAGVSIALRDSSPEVFRQLSGHGASVVETRSPLSWLAEFHA